MSSDNDIMRSPVGEQRADRFQYDVIDKHRQLRQRVGALENSVVSPATAEGAAGVVARKNSLRRPRAGSDAITLQVARETEVLVPGARQGAIVIGQSYPGRTYVRLDPKGRRVFVGFSPFRPPIGPPAMDPITATVVVVPL